MKERVVGLINSAEKEGANILLDGRNATVPKYPRGNFVGPTVIENVEETMECYREEIFGPVLLIIKKDSLDDAISLINRYTNIHIYIHIYI